MKDIWKLPLLSAVHFSTAKQVWHSEMNPKFTHIHEKRFKKELSPLVKTIPFLYWTKIFEIKNVD